VLAIACPVAGFQTVRRFSLCGNLLRAINVEAMLTV
jgi:hypothetical protein